MLDVKPNRKKNSKPTLAMRLGAYLFSAVCFLYLAVVVSIFVLSRYAESWWLATLVLFSPRLVLWIPLLLLFLSWLAVRTRLGLVAIVAAAAFSWPLAGIHVPMKRWLVASPATDGDPIHFVTINMHSINKVPRELDRFLSSTSIEVVAIQNWDASDECFLRFLPGWHVHYSRSHFLASRFPIKSAVDIGDESRGEKGAVYHYELDTPQGLVHVFSLHLATNRDGVQSLLRNEAKGPKLIQDNSDRRLAQSKHIHDHVASCEGPVVVMGDFNTPNESPHYARVWGGLANAFEQAGLGWGYTFIGDATMVRIDHVLASEHWHIESCSVGPKVGSPHRPVVASLVRKQP